MTELKARQKAKDLYDNIDEVFITFANVETKLFVEQELKSTKSQLSLKLLRIGSVLRLTQCMQQTDETEPPLKRQRSTGRFGSVHIVESTKPGSNYYADEFMD